MYIAYNGFFLCVFKKKMVQRLRTKSFTNYIIVFHPSIIVLHYSIGNMLSFLNTYYHVLNQ